MKKLMKLVAILLFSLSVNAINPCEQKGSGKKSDTTSVQVKTTVTTVKKKEIREPDQKNWFLYTFFKV